MNEEQVKRLHQRIQYLEDVITAFFDFLKLRFDAAISEEVPPAVRVARAADEAYHDDSDG